MVFAYPVLQEGAARLWFSNYIAPWAKRFSLFSAPAASLPIVTAPVSSEVSQPAISRWMATKNGAAGESMALPSLGPVRLLPPIRQLYLNDTARLNFGTAAAWQSRIPLRQTNRYNLRMGMSPLHGAVILRDVQLVGRYIESGNVDPRDREGQTPLMYALQQGDTEIAKELIAAGADVNAQDSSKGRTPLHWVIRMSEGSVKKKGEQIPMARALKLLQLLVDAGADPTIKDAQGFSAIEQAARWMSDKNGNNSALEILSNSRYVRGRRQIFPLKYPFSLDASEGFGRSVGNRLQDS